MAAILDQPDISGRFVRLAAKADASKGKFSHVFEAEDLATKRPAVLKFLRPDLHDDQDKEYFKREGEISLALRGHPNFIQLVAPPASHRIVLKLESGSPLPVELQYLANERAVRDFSAFLFGPRKRPPALWRRLQVIRDVVKGVNKLHNLGFCHRDLKPDNIFLSAGGAAKLGDLGLCRTLSGTKTIGQDYSLPVGHALYAAPETFCGAASRSDLYTRADWFAVGAILFESIAGVKLYTAIGLQSGMELLFLFGSNGPLTEFERVAADISGSYPIPDLEDYTPKDLFEGNRRETLQRVDSLIRDLCHFDHRRRLRDFNQIMRRLDIAIGSIHLAERSRVRPVPFVGFRSALR